MGLEGQGQPVQVDIGNPAADAGLGPRMPAGAPPPFPTRSAAPLPKRSRLLPRWLMAFLALAAVAAIVALNLRPRSVALPSLTHDVARRDLSVMVTEQGTLESTRNTEIRCKVKGTANTVVWIVKNGAEVQEGDVLVRIDTSTIETNINTQEIAYQNALATFAQSQSDAAVAEINVTEYVEGTYLSELKTKEKDVAIAEANLRSAQNMMEHAINMFRRGYISQLELQGNEFSLQQAQLELDVKKTDLEVLSRYTRAKKLQDLNGILAAKKAKLASDTAALALEKSKLDREKQQLENCVIRAPTSGMVTYARYEEWEDIPEIREGATVREDQVLLLLPDLRQMQIKVGVHESVVDRVRPGQKAAVEILDARYTGEVSTIASMSGRSGWWNGNMVKYETIIRLDENAIRPDDKLVLKPGMSATVRIAVAEYDDVVAVPVAAVVEEAGKYYCWVTAESRMEKRPLELGDTDDQFLIVHGGLREGEHVVLNPLVYVDEAQRGALTPYSGIDVQPEATTDNVARTDEAQPREQQSGATEATDLAKPAQEMNTVKSEESTRAVQPASGAVGAGA